MTYKWYTHTSKPVCEQDVDTVLWNQGVHTDREVTAHKPDIITRNIKEKICILGDVAVPADRNMHTGRCGSTCGQKYAYWEMWQYLRTEICILGDVAVPADRNVVQKEAEKKLKYKSSCIVM